MRRPKVTQSLKLTEAQLSILYALCAGTVDCTEDHGVRRMCESVMKQIVKQQPEARWGGRRRE